METSKSMLMMFDSSKRRKLSPPIEEDEILIDYVGDEAEQEAKKREEKEERERFLMLKDSIFQEKFDEALITNKLSLNFANVDLGHLAYKSIDDKFAVEKIIPFLKKNKSVQSIEITFHEMGDESLSCIFSIPSLRSINIFGKKAENLFFNAIQQNKSIQSLSLSEFSIENKDIKLICENSSIMNLEFHDCYMVSGAAVEILNNNNIKNLTISSEYVRLALRECLKPYTGISEYDWAMMNVRKSRIDNYYKGCALFLSASNHSYNIPLITHFYKRNTYDKNILNSIFEFSKPNKFNIKFGR